MPKFLTGFNGSKSLNLLLLRQNGKESSVIVINDWCFWKDCHWKVTRCTGWEGMKQRFLNALPKKGAWDASSSMPPWCSLPHCILLFKALENFSKNEDKTKFAGPFILRSTAHHAAIPERIRKARIRRKSLSKMTYPPPLLSSQLPTLAMHELHSLLPHPRKSGIFPDWIIVNTSTSVSYKCMHL